jgi:predicted nucleotidyltransferase
MDILNLSKSKLRQKLLRLYFSHPEKKYYIRQLARMFNQPAAYVRRELLRLEKEGLFTSEFVGKERFFALNKKHYLYLEIKKIISKTIGIEGALRQDLAKIKGIKEAYLFGSYAKDRLGPESDIDVLIIGSADPEKIIKKVVSWQKKFKREFNVIDMSEAEFKKRKRNKDELLLNILSSKLIKLL